MKQCRKCGVFVDDDLANCPLCGAFAHDETNSTIYEYPEVNIKTKRKLFLKISLFVSIFTMALVLAINLAVNHKVSWSIHVIFGFALIWLCISRRWMAPVRLLASALIATGFSSLIGWEASSVA